MIYKFLVKLSILALILIGLTMGTIQSTYAIYNATQDVTGYAVKMVVTGGEG